MKLIKNKEIEIAQDRRGVRFVSQQKGPHIRSKVINNNQIIFVAGEANNRRGPQIIVNKLEGKIGNII